jgi:FixJ family two-component response regulator
VPEAFAAEKKHRRPGHRDPTTNGTDVSSNSPLVAVVDDEEPVCRALERLLRSAGFTVTTFVSGAAFLQSLKARRPACLVLDLHMPRMSGFELQEHLAEAADPMPVVVITGHDTPQSRDRVVNAGAAAYLRKPVDDNALLDAVLKAIAPKVP